MCSIILYLENEFARLHLQDECKHIAGIEFLALGDPTVKSRNRLASRITEDHIVLTKQVRSPVVLLIPPMCHVEAILLFCQHSKRPLVAELTIAHKRQGYRVITPRDFVHFLQTMVKGRIPQISHPLLIQTAHLIPMDSIIVEELQLWLRLRSISLSRRASLTTNPHGTPASYYVPSKPGIDVVLYPPRGANVIYMLVQFPWLCVLSIPDISILCERLETSRVAVSARVFFNKQMLHFYIVGYSGLNLHDEQPRPYLNEVFDILIPPNTGLENEHFRYCSIPCDADSKIRKCKLYIPKVQTTNTKPNFVSQTQNLVSDTSYAWISEYEQIFTTMRI